MPTWVVVLIATVVGGGVVVMVLAFLAIYGVRKYLTNAKQLEARNTLGAIAQDAAVAYERDSHSAGTPDGLCASASRTIPSSVSMVRGARYQSAPGEWTVDASKPRTGFACLNFSYDMPQYYMYSYAAHGVRTPGDGFTATANGDLNGDGVLSTFSLSGRVSADGTLAIAPSLVEKNPEE